MRPVTVALLQGLYFFPTAVWPLLDIDSFMAVTGPKNDLWLVRTVGVLLAVIALVLLLAWKNKRVTAETALRGAGCAVAMASIDIIYVLNDTISPIYLADAAAEAVLLIVWAISFKNHRSDAPARFAK